MRGGWASSATGGATGAEAAGARVACASSPSTSNQSSSPKKLASTPEPEPSLCFLPDTRYPAGLVVNWTDLLYTIRTVRNRAEALRTTT
jgi:hypothetical protein